MAEESRKSRYRASSPTEDEPDESSEKSTSRELEHSAWPSFPETDALNFKSDFVDGVRLPLLLYIFRGSVTSISVSNAKYILEVFHQNECKLYAAFKNNFDISEKYVQQLLSNRSYLVGEIRREFGLSENV